MKKKTETAILVTGAIAITALAFIVGFSLGVSKEKRLVVNAKGELVKQEVDE